MNEASRNSRFSKGFRAARNLALTGAVAASTAALVAQPSSPPPAAADHTLPKIVSLPGFDSCSALTVPQMQTWWSYSGYYTKGVYIGGEELAPICDVPDASWVTSVTDQGWGLAFIWVGLQAPCTGFANKMSYDVTTALNQGRAAAQAAHDQLDTMGAHHPTIAYMDMEAFDSNNVACRKAVSGFVKGWEDRLDDFGDQSGYYSGSANGIAALVTEKCWEESACPDNVWMANYDNRNSVWGDVSVPDTLWINHQRVHQYNNSHLECNGPEGAEVCQIVDDNCNLGQVAGSNGHDPADDIFDPVTQHPQCGYYPH